MASSYNINMKRYNGTDYDTLYPATSASQVNGLSATIISTMQSQILNMVYPVGAIYISTSSTEPSTLFGGTWVRIKDTFLLSAGDTYAGGTTGGEATHTLTVNEMPQHYHSLTMTDSEDNDYLGGSEASYGINKTGTGAAVGKTATSGGGQAHNNMPPYLAVYVWKRTA